MPNVSPSELNPIAAKLAQSDDPEKQVLSKYLAKYLDEWLRIPGTDKRIGLDPILAFFPGIGDMLVTGAGGVILLDALRSGIPFSTFLHMALNMCVNFLLGLIPGIAPFLTAFYKSNSRNLAMLQTWQAGQHGEVKKSTLRFFIGLVILIALLICFVVTIWFLYSFVFYSFLKSLGMPSWLF